jgi:hypothetical protein
MCVGVVQVCCRSKMCSFRVWSGHDLALVLFRNEEMAASCDRLLGAAECQPPQQDVSFRWCHHYRSFCPSDNFRSSVRKSCAEHSCRKRLKLPSRPILPDARQKLVPIRPQPEPAIPLAMDTGPPLRTSLKQLPGGPIIPPPASWGVNAEKEKEREQDMKGSKESNRGSWQQQDQGGDPGTAVSGRPTCSASSSIIPSSLHNPTAAPNNGKTVDIGMAASWSLRAAEAAAQAVCSATPDAGNNVDATSWSLRAGEAAVQAVWEVLVGGTAPTVQQCKQIQSNYSGAATLGTSTCGAVEVTVTRLHNGGPGNNIVHHQTTLAPAAVHPIAPQASNLSQPQATVALAPQAVNHGQPQATVAIAPQATVATAPQASGHLQPTFVIAAIP